jgi:hypothetical protein
MKRITFKQTQFLLVLLLLVGGVACAEKHDDIVIPSGENSLFFTTTMRGFNLAERSDKYGESDFATLYDWGVNSVRYLAGGSRFIDPNPPHLFIKKDFERLDQVLDWCEKYTLYLIINLHQMPGYRYVGEDDNSLWISGAYQTLLVEFWKAIAKRYRDRGDVLAYDLLNEPHGADGHWIELAKRITRAIREIDITHTIVVEAEGWSYPDDFAALQITGDPNTVYSPHMYLPHYITHGRGSGAYPGKFLYEGNEYRWNKEKYSWEYQAVVDFQEKYDVPVWVGEFGCIRWLDGFDQWIADQVSLFESHGWGWSWYSFREWHAMNLELSKEEENQDPPPEEPSHLKLIKALLKGEGP